jgi:predicted nucleic acid-binding protein
MPMRAKAFADTYVLLQLLSDDERKAQRAEALLQHGPTISVQVLNEIVSVTTRKLGMPVDEVAEFCYVLRRLCHIEPITTDHHDLALSLLRRYGFSMYDALIVATALIADCRRLYTEDLQHNHIVLRQLRIVNPFQAVP